MQSVKAGDEVIRRAADASAQIAKSVLQNRNVKASAKVATDELAEMQWQRNVSIKSVDSARRRLAKVRATSSLKRKLVS